MDKDITKMTRDERIAYFDELNKKGFEGDSNILKEIKKLIKKFDVHQIIETGTFKGHTTLQLSKLKPVLTCEISPEYFREAKNNLANIPNIIMYLGNSVNALNEVLPTYKNTNTQVLFYLDAHWNDYCPLLDELKSIANAGLKPVIVIHDFKVPGRPELGYDSYKGQDFTFEWIEPVLKEIYGEEFEYHYNSKAEGAMRGVIYIYPKTK